MEYFDISKLIPNLDSMTLDESPSTSDSSNSSTINSSISVLSAPSTEISSDFEYLEPRKTSSASTLITDPKLQDLYKTHLLQLSSIEFGPIIGNGNFGYVQQAIYSCNYSKPEKVAIKKLRRKHKKEAMLREIQILSFCQHKNVLSFIGFIEGEDEQPCIVTEFMEGGSLDGFLRNSEMPLTVDKIFDYIFQILDAMVYLCHKHILHRDLAARNCLLNETFSILKICDFGLSREMNPDYEYISRGNDYLPFRILPVEALIPPTKDYQTFTFKGDIWAFGILIWEMFERGGELYNGMGFQQLIGYLTSGKRLIRPQQCPDKLYNLMYKCWDPLPINRPIFDVIKLYTEQIYQELKESDPECLGTRIGISKYAPYHRGSEEEAAMKDIKPYPSYNGFYIFIKGSNGKLMSGENGLRPLKCDRKDAGDWEMFVVENFGNAIIALKSRGNYVCSENGIKPVTCNRKLPSDWEKFEWIENLDGTFSLKGNNRKFLSRDNGEGLMICNSGEIGNFERFTFIDYYNMPLIRGGGIEEIQEAFTFIKGSNGKYVSSEDGYNPMRCNREEPLCWEKFVIEDLGGGKVAIKCNGKYVTSEAGERPIWCNRATINDWEKFEIINFSDKQFLLKGGNGMYVTVMEDGKDEDCTLICNAENPENAEKFCFCL